MSDLSVSFGCGDYPTNDMPSDKIKYDKRLEEKWDKEMRAKGYLQDSTGNWYNPNDRFVYDLDW